MYELCLIFLFYTFTYFKFIYKLNKTPKIIYIIYYLYITTVLLLTIVPNSFITDFKWLYDDYQSFSYINTILFRDIKMGYHGAIKDIVLNILMLIPFGFIIPMLKSNITLLKITLYTFMFSFLIEFIQLITTILFLNHRICDITDLFTNTIGGVIGYIIYKITAYKKEQ